MPSWMHLALVPNCTAPQLCVNYFFFSFSNLCFATIALETEATDHVADCPEMSFAFDICHKYQKYKSVELGGQLQTM